MKKKKISSSKNQSLKITIYLLLRGLVFISMIGQALNQNWNNVLLCIITLMEQMDGNLYLKRLCGRKNKMTIDREGR